MSIIEQLEMERLICNTIEASIENTTVPDAIAAHADKRAGKPVTVKDAEQLEGQLGLPVRISRAYGMTSVMWMQERSDRNWSTAKSITIANDDTNVRWPTGAELKAKQVAFYGARDERNEKRKLLLQEHSTMRSAIGDSVPGVDDESTIYRVVCAIRQIHEARDVLQKLVDYREPMYVMRTVVGKIVGDLL